MALSQFLATARTLRNETMPHCASWNSPTYHAQVWREQFVPAVAVQGGATWLEQKMRSVQDFIAVNIFSLKKKKIRSVQDFIEVNSFSLKFVLQYAINHCSHLYKLLSDTRMPHNVLIRKFESWKRNLQTENYCYQNGCKISLP